MAVDLACRCGNSAVLPIDSHPSVGGFYVRWLVRHGSDRLYVCAIADSERLAEADVAEQVAAWFAGFHDR